MNSNGASHIHIYELCSKDTRVLSLPSDMCNHYISKSFFGFPIFNPFLFDTGNQTSSQTMHYNMFPCVYFIVVWWNVIWMEDLCYSQGLQHLTPRWKWICDWLKSWVMSICAGCLPIVLTPQVLQKMPKSLFHFVFEHTISLAAHETKLIAAGEAGLKIDEGYLKGDLPQIY